jgi:hypothetical protein
MIYLITVSVLKETTMGNEHINIGVLILILCCNFNFLNE